MRLKSIKVVHNTPHEAFCIVLSMTNCVLNCQFLHVKTKVYKNAFIICMSARSLPIWASDMGIDDTKIVILLQNLLYFVA